MWPWCHLRHSLVSENVSILVGVKGQLKDAVHNAALDSHLGVLQLVFARVLPNGITGHGTVQVAQKILHCCRLVIRCCAALERCREAADNRCETRLTTELNPRAVVCVNCTGNQVLYVGNRKINTH